MKTMAKSPKMPRFKNESQEADWWASAAGRAFVKRKSTGGRKSKTHARGSKVVAKLNETASVQIALRLPQADIAQARKIAERKGIGYQTLLKMLVREGLIREDSRAK